MFFSLTTKNSQIKTKLWYLRAGLKVGILMWLSRYLILSTT